MGKTIRIDEELWAALKVRAVQERVTLGQFCERVLAAGVAAGAAVPKVTGSVERSRQSTAVATGAESTAALTKTPVALERCPKCGCRPVMHQAGAQGDRCERHPTCRWRAEDGD